MKKKWFILALLLPVFFAAKAQSDYKVIFDITSKDTASHKSVLRQASGIVKANPDAQVEVVIYSNALDLAVKDKSVIATPLAELLKDDRVQFKVCAITMKRHNVAQPQLVPGIQVVDDGIYEIIKRQREGWGYIKVN